MSRPDANKKKLHKCADCGLHYESEKLATDCFDFCTKNRACSLEITKHSIESQEHRMKLEKNRKNEE